MTTNGVDKKSDVSTFEDSRLRQLEERLYKAQRARDNYLQNVQPSNNIDKNSFPPLLLLNKSNKSVGNRSKSDDARRRRSKSKSKTKNIYSFQPPRQVPHPTEHPTKAAAVNLLWLEKTEKNQYREHRNNERNAHLRQGLLSRMETSHHFWNISKTMERPYHSTTQLNTQLPTSQSIPTSSLLLDSDMPEINNKLGEIRQSLDNLKNFRLNMPCKDYFHSIYPVSQSNHIEHHKKSRFQPICKSFEAQGFKEVPSTAEILTRIMNIEFYIEKRVREIIYSNSNRNIATVNDEDLPTSSSGNDIPPNVVPSNQQHSFNQPDIRLVSSEVKSESSVHQNISFSHSNVATATESRKQEIIEPAPQKTYEAAITQSRIEFKSLPDQTIPKATDLSINSLNNRMDQNKLETASKPEENSSSYSRMLELLKKPAAHYEVSSSSSDTEPSLGINRRKAVAVNLNKSTLGSNSVDLKSLAALQLTSSTVPPANNNIASSSTAKKPLYSGIKTDTKENDSDSDFFN